MLIGTIFRSVYRLQQFTHYEAPKDQLLDGKLYETEKNTK